MYLAKSVLATLMLASFTAMSPAHAISTHTQDAGGGQLQADLTKALNNKRYRDVKATAQDGVATLSGTVTVYSDKQEAEKKAQKVKGITRVDNQIQVAGPTVSDQELAQKLGNKLATDRVGYGTTVFNAITVQVHDGVVRLGGVVYGPPDKDSALGLVSNYPGVKGIDDKIQVAPTSPNDDRIRRDVQRAIYGYPTFTKYGINPAKPIRIIVINGNVTLVGAVDSKGDSDQAALRANGVGGVFKVTNDLQYPGQTGDK